jgi:hypothetical protein
MKKRFVLIVGLAVLTVVSGAFPSAFAGTTITEESSDSYSVTSEFMNFLYTGSMGQDALSITDFEVSDGKNKVFEEIRINFFSPVNEPYVDSSGLRVVAEGQYATATVHSNPAATFEFATFRQNAATFKFSTDVGAIDMGSHLFIGNENLRAELILLGDGNISKTSANEFSIEMESSSSMVFRNDFIGQEPIGDRIADGAIAGELFVSKDQYSVTEDLVEYLPMSMEITSSGTDELEVEVSGDFDEGKVLIFDISREVLTMSKDDLTVKMDGQDVPARPIDEILEASGRESGYALLETGEYFQVYLYMPSFSTHTITFGGATPGHFEILAGMGLAVAVTSVSAIFLFKRRKED